MEDLKAFSKKQMMELHGDMWLYRDLYKGKHANHFNRAKQLIEKGEIVDYLEGGKREAVNVRTPYLVVNISRIICDIPALLISRSLDDIKTNHKHEEATVRASTTEEDEIIEGTRDDSYNEAVTDLQQELLDQIVTHSNLTRQHKSNIVQHQVDGGIVGVPVYKDGIIRIEFKERNIYYPHKDNLGVTLRYEIPPKEESDLTDYVHEYIERVDYDNDKLTATHKLYSRDQYGRTTLVEDPNEIEEIIGQVEMYREFKGRKRPFINYWANNATFINPLGVSELEGQEGKQEEVNWTVTRSAQTFERNGRPRISVSSEVMTRLEELADERGSKRIDHRDLEVTEMNEKGEALKIHQIDIGQIGDMTYVKDIIKMMLSETNTSEKVTDFLNDDGTTASAQSGVAKFYDLFISLIKAETLQKEYIEFLQNLFESALWLANQKNPNVIIEKPVVNTVSMIPTPKDETDKVNIEKFNAGVQSLETTVRQLNPDKSDEWVEREMDRIITDKGSDDSFSLARGRQTIQNMFGNRNAQGEHLNEDGTVRDEE